MINKNFFNMLILLGVLFTFNACDDDNDIVLPVGELIENTELQVVLVAMGFEFDSENKLVMDDKATSLTSLDLTSKTLTSYEGLDIFPALEEVILADNGLETFDFSTLPSNITKVNLQGNNLYKFENLAETELTKLYLPETAKYNMEEVLDYYTANKDDGIDMQIVIDGTLEAYSYLRSIPDAVLLAELKESFPSVFQGDQIDLSKEMNILEAGNGLSIGTAYKSYENDIASLEGIQYIVGFENFTGNILINVQESANVVVDYFKIPSLVNSLTLINQIVDVMDWSGALNLEGAFFINVAGVTKVDLSASEVSGLTYMSLTAGIGLENCPDIEKIIFPDRDNLQYIAITIEDVPNLKVLDMSNITLISNYASNNFIGIPNCEITWPVALSAQDDTDEININVDQDVSEMASTIAFASKFENIINYKIVEEESSKLMSKLAAVTTSYYSGILEPIMNDTTYDDVNSTFTISDDNTNSTMDLYLPPFQVGSMPGELHIDIQDTAYTTATNGNISFTGSQTCVYLEIGIFTFDMDGDYNGTLINDQFYFHIDSEDTVLFWTISADVTFNGTKD